MNEEMRTEAMELCVTACEKFSANNEVYNVTNILIHLIHKLIYLLFVMLVTLMLVRICDISKLSLVSSISMIYDSACTVTTQTFSPEYITQKTQKNHKIYTYIIIHFGYFTLYHI